MATNDMVTTNAGNSHSFIPRKRKGERVDAEWRIDQSRGQGEWNLSKRRKGPKGRRYDPGPTGRTGPVMQRRNGDNDIRSKPWRERWREQKRNKWARWVTARRKSRANGCLNARSARSALPRTSFPVVLTLATSEKFNNPTNGLAVAYYSYTHDPCGRVAANSTLNGVTIEFRPWIIGDFDRSSRNFSSPFLPRIYCSSFWFSAIVLFSPSRKKRLIFSSNFVVKIFKDGFGWFYRILAIADAMNSLSDSLFYIISRIDILKLNFTLFVHARPLLIAINKRATCRYY